ncbi:hypothetical protein IFM89_027804 [Coptis chinensis]|uniref:Uncharacterized protein n=1 Tax=Coptis chinensis TaxID=261450 RepID=A0A835IXK5_9MAGN|nr:hypothetical protein IFM89_027804 [Coptis chinensis]
MFSGGELDYLVVDALPRTFDKYITIVQLLQATGINGAIIVTTLQQVSLIDVRKEINFCKKVGERERDDTEWALEYLRKNAPEMLNLVACSEVFDTSGGGATKISWQGTYGSPTVQGF